MPKNRGNYINAKLILKRELNQMNINFRISIQRSLISDLELVNIVVDGCRLFALNARNPILKAMVDKLLQSGNIPRRGCPMKAVDLHICGS